MNNNVINPGQGYGFSASGNGFNINLPITPVDDTFGAIFGVNLPEIPNIPYVVVPQFQCFVVPGTGGYAGKSILTIASGGVNYTNSNMPNIKEGVEQNNSQAFITKTAVQSDGVIAVPGTVPITPLTPFMEDNGFYVLNNPSDKYYVVLSYYDCSGDADPLDIPILTLRTPWVSIVKEGSPEYIKLFIEQGPSYYTGLLNIAPMVNYTTPPGVETKYFGFNHTCYFNPVKFGANIKIISTVQNNIVNQYAHGSQNLTIPLLNHGTKLMYVPGMTEQDDPYWTVTFKDLFDTIVNKSDITALSSLSFTGGWWNQVTDNVTPRTVTINNYSYYSINYENTDNMREFTCSVYGLPAGEGSEEPTHRLRIKSGLVTFKTSSANAATGIITSDPVITNLRINEANIYPQGKKNEGTDENPDYIHQDGYIELDEGSDYYVFIYKVTPNFSNDPSCKAPQLVISKIDGTPNTKIKTIKSGGGETTSYIVSEPKTLFLPNLSEEGFIGTFNNAEVSCDLVDIGGYSPHAVFESYLINVTGEVQAKDVAGPLKDKGIGYVKTDCYRKDLAYIKWDAPNNRFIVRQLHTGPVVLEDTPIHLGNTIVELESEIGWEFTGSTEPTEEIVGASFPGYTQALNDGSTNQYDGSTDPINYLPAQPSQIESPNGEPY